MAIAVAGARRVKLRGCLKSPLYAEVKADSLVDIRRLRER
jgi:hypothetical protein